jgi:predicted porin
MKVSKFYIGILLTLIAPFAMAQSSVTIYGRVNEDIEYMTGLPTSGGSSTSRVALKGGDLGTSLWGLQGSEDIGGGNKILFHFEDGFNGATGQLGSTTSFWNRWAVVGTSNDSLGTALVGRQLNISYGVWYYDPMLQSAWSSASLVRGRTWHTTADSISYQSPKVDGFDMYGQYSLSNATNWNGNGSTTQGRSDGLRLTYRSALFQVSGQYDETRDPANGRLDDVFLYSREYLAAANVFLGQFKVQFAYQTSHADANPISVASETRHVWGGLTWQATAAASVVAAVYHINANNGVGNATMYTLMTTYNISKRTMLDMQVATVRNSKTGTFSLEANLPGSADDPLAGHTQTGVYAGIQHQF